MILDCLSSILNDRARKLVARLSDEVASDSDLLTAAILREYQLTPIKYREHFLSITKRNNETFSQLSTRIEIALKYYLESRKVELNDNNKDLYNLLVSDRLKECVPEQFQDFIRARELEKWLKPQELCDALDVYCTDQLSKSSSQSNQQKSNPNAKTTTQQSSGSGSSSRPAPLQRTSQIICARCARPGHTAPNCVTKLSQDQFKEKLGDKFKGSKFKEWKGKVNSVGKAENSRNTAGKVPSHVKCYECGENHYKNSCPKLQSSKISRVFYSSNLENSSSAQNEFSNSTESLNFQQLENDTSVKRGCKPYFFWGSYFK